MVSEADGQRVEAGYEFWLCFFKARFYFNNISIEKVNKNEVQNKKRYKILLAALK